MALKIRRGLESDRLGFTPAEGELVYTTDQKRLYVGDGTTAGGTLVTGSGGSGYINTGTAQQLAFYPVNGAEIDSITAVTWNGSELDVDSPLTVSALGAEKLRMYAYTTDAFIETATDIDLRIKSRVIDFGDESDNTSNRIRILNGASGVSLAFLKSSVTSAETPSLLTLNRSRGTLGAPLTVANGDKLFDLRYTAFDGTDDVAVSAVRTEVSGTVSTGKVPGRLRFLTANATTGALTTAFVVESDQTVKFTQGVIFDAAPSGLVFTNTDETHNHYSSNSSSRNFTFAKHRGSSSSPTTVQNNDTLYTVRFQGYDGTALQTAAFIRGEVNGAPGTGRVPGRIRFSTTDINGVTATAMVINNQQDVYITNNAVVGGNIDNGQIRLSGNYISTYVSNANLELRANGSGKVIIEGLQYPNTDGTNGQVLTTNGAGLLSWTSVSGSGTGSVTFTGSNIDTTDSSGISFTPAVVFNSDVLVDNDLRVSNTVYAEEFVSTSVGTPEITSATTIDLNAGVAVRITGGTLRLKSYSSTERNALVAANGDAIYNSTTNAVEFYQNGVWGGPTASLSGTIVITDGGGITLDGVGPHIIGALDDLEISSGTNLSLISLGVMSLASVGPIDIDSGTGSNPITIKSGPLILETSLPPATASSTGVRGTIAWDADYVYVCTATNTWKRSALTTW